MPSDSAQLSFLGDTGSHVLDSTPPPKLYPGQRDGVTTFLDLAAPRRHIYAWDTGCGKTAGALTVISKWSGGKVRIPRVLIVCPALVRGHWLREFEVWAPKLRPSAAIIEWGRKTKLNGKLSLARKWAYDAPIQIVSYDLLREVDVTSWDLIVIDEIHHIANPDAQCSKVIREMLHRDNRVDVLGLSATLIPTEAQQLWNPLRLLFPHDGWGRPWKGGGISWGFKSRYCNIETTEYGSEAYGVREEMRGELRRRLSACCHVLTRADISKDLPPLDLHCVTLKEAKLKGRQEKYRKPIYRSFEWAEANAETDKIVVLVHHREVARAIKSQVEEASLALRNHHVYYIDGSVPTSARDLTLINCATAPKAILIATHDSLLEGIRLMWAQQVLIDEWSMSPGKMIQLMGRFNSVGSTARPCVNLATDEDTWGPAQTLIYRLKVVTDLLGEGKTQEQLLDSLERAGELSEDSVKAGWLDMFASANLETDREEWAE